MPTIWRHIHAFLQQAHPTEHILEDNDDLIGFFNAVPTYKILDALRILISEYLSQGHPKKFSVTLSPKSDKDKVFQGKPRGGSSTRLKNMNIHDLCQIVQLSFNCGIFQVVHKVYRQIRGTSVGNQISPILSSLPIILAERTWLKSFQHQVFQGQLSPSMALPALIVRYVDNRLVLPNAATRSCSHLQTFLDAHFYEDPIELEKVTDHMWFGFRVNAPDRSVQYVLPVQPWQTRIVNSAGSWQARTAGYRSRAALIRMYSFPKSSVAAQLQALHALYRRRGFPSEVLR